MPEKEAASRSRLKNEVILFATLAAFGVLLLPAAIFMVGKAVFGSYGGGGYIEFHGDLLGRLLAVDAAALFLVLSPYLLVQLLRASLRLLRRPVAD